jgi:hypothetical protein
VLGTGDRRGDFVTLGAIAHGIGLVPWLAAVRANRRTSLWPALLWAVAAWLAWGWALTAWQPRPIYVALVLSGCAGVAVLGARRPGVAAWNFVVVGLLCVMVLPLAEGALTGADVRLDAIRTIFLIGLWAVVVGNYLPTRLGAAATLAGVAGAMGIAQIVRPELDPGNTLRWIAAVSLWMSPWLGWLGVTLSQPTADVDRTWRTFRDRFGAIWALRVQDQFNRSAANANSGARLRWCGVAAADAAADERLVALLSRFGWVRRQ